MTATIILFTYRARRNNWLIFLFIYILARGIGPVSPGVRIILKKGIFFLTRNINLSAKVQHNKNWHNMQWSLINMNFKR